MTQSEALIHEENRRLWAVIEAARVHVRGVDATSYFDIQQTFNDLKAKLVALEETEEREQIEATR